MTTETKHTPESCPLCGLQGAFSTTYKCRACSCTITEARVMLRERLNAAAPELLEVLRVLRDKYRGLDSHHQHSLHPDDFKRIEAAIAKAEGR